MENTVAHQFIPVWFVPNDRLLFHDQGFHWHVAGDRVIGWGKTMTPNPALNASLVNKRQR